MKIKNEDYTVDIPYLYGYNLGGEIKI